MRIARVESALDRARDTFERGLEEACKLSGFDRDWLLEQHRSGYSNFCKTLYIPKASREDLAAAIGDALASLEGDTGDEDNDYDDGN